MKFKRIFVKGGIKRMKYSLPALIFSLFRLSQELVNRPPMEQEEEVKQVDEDELQVKLVKVDQPKIFKCIAECIGLVKS